MPLSMALGYIKHAIEQEQEAVAWDLWVGTYPLMASGLMTFQSFDEFKRTLYKPRHQYSQKSPEEIEQEMLAVVAKYEGR